MKTGTYKELGENCLFCLFMSGVFLILSVFMLLLMSVELATYVKGKFK